MTPAEKSVARMKADGRRLVTEDEFHAHIRRWPKHHPWTWLNENYWSTSIEDYCRDDRWDFVIAHTWMDWGNENDAVWSQRVFEIFEPPEPQP